jgi:hypothetical protein
MYYHSSAAYKKITVPKLLKLKSLIYEWSTGCYTIKFERSASLGSSTVLFKSANGPLKFYQDYIQGFPSATYDEYCQFTNLLDELLIIVRGSF